MEASNTNIKNNKIKRNDSFITIKVKTESNGLGVLKTIIVLTLIALQAAILILSQLYFMKLFQWMVIISLIITGITCIHVLSSEYHGQAKATWILFLLISFEFGYIIYIMSDKRLLFSKSKRKFQKIQNSCINLQQQTDLSNITNKNVRANCNYLYNAGNFVSFTNSKSTYFSSGTTVFDEILKQLEKAESFIFIEYFIIADGVLLNRLLDILRKKAKKGVDVKIIYDDMGSHGTLKRKTKKKIIKSGIKLLTFNRLVPVFNIALNLRDHRKIVIIDGKVAFTGGTNLADEYINEKRTHGYWKDEGIKLEGKCVDNFTIAFLNQWQFLTNADIDYSQYINRALDISTNENSIIVPFVSGPNYPYSIAQNIYANQIANAEEKLYIMTPYFIPDETILNLIINKARSGVDVRIILPDIADKKFVYVVTRSNAEKLIEHGVKVYTMTNSFVHSKVMLTENSAIVGSINMDLRSFNQQFESAVFTNEKSTLKDIALDFTKTMCYSKEVTMNNRKRNHLSYRILAGLFNLISPFM